MKRKWHQSKKYTRGPKEQAELNSQEENQSSEEHDHESYADQSLLFTNSQAKNTVDSADKDNLIKDVRERILDEAKLARMA